MVSVLDRCHSECAVEGAADAGQVIARETDVIVSECDVKTKGHGSWSRHWPACGRPAGRGPAISSATNCVSDLPVILRIISSWAAGCRLAYPAIGERRLVH